jgi:uncharacterized membrane protein (DUF485 family)
MRGMPDIFRPKWRLFLDGHTRLHTRPDPALAETKFQRRVQRSARITMLRTACFVMIYFSFVAAGVGFLLDYLTLVPEIGRVLGILKTVASSVTVVFIAGVFVCNRYLSYLEVEMLFYSMETRLPAPQA